MKTRLLVIAMFWAAAVSAAVPTQINYQGHLAALDGTPLDTTVALAVRIYDAPTEGTVLWTENHASVLIEQGLFDVMLGSQSALPDSIWKRNSLWLGVTVGSNSELVPRERLVAVPYAMRVASVDSAEGGTVAGNVHVTGKMNIGPGTSNSGTSAFAAGAYNVASGDYSTVSGGYNNESRSLYGTASGGNGNDVLGDYATVGGGWSNTARGHSATVGGGNSNSADSNYATVGGGTNNRASQHAATVGGGDRNIASGERATISGGQTNSASAYATVGGGNNNSAGYLFAFVGGGDGNQSSGNAAMVGGGRSNTASGYNSTVGGGFYNQGTGYQSTVAGGDNNTASNDNTTVGGGSTNTASGLSATVSGGNYNVANGPYATVGGGHYCFARGDFSVVCGGGGASFSDSNNAGFGAVVPGGRANRALGSYSLAAGQHARADHAGAFVWSDASVLTDFVSNAMNQFNVRSAGGVRVFTNSGASVGVTLDASDNTWNSVCDSTLKTNIRSVDTRDILDRVSRLPIKRWSFKDGNPNLEHISPMAQDFWSLFHVGGDSLKISTLDPTGIALAAIQELAKQNAELRARIEKLEAKKED